MTRGYTPTTCYFLEALWLDHWSSSNRRQRLKPLISTWVATTSSSPALGIFVICQQGRGQRIPRREQTHQAMESPLERRAAGSQGSAGNLSRAANGSRAAPPAGGIRVPGLIHVPWQIRGNQNVSTPATTADFLPTIMWADRRYSRDIAEI